MELATVNDENPCSDRGLDAVCPPVAIDGTGGEKWRRRESNPRVQSRNSQVAQRLWNMLQDVGVKGGVRSAFCQFDVANPPDRMASSQWSSLNVVFSGNAAGHLLRNWTSGGRGHQTTHGQGLRVS